ncbi:Hypothetical protein A7982_05726 [Minicystis rosea]|nr:Hypothetical protein A7982_05726 [Minicystis rosea]
MSNIEPLPPALRALFDDERSAYPDRTEARARVLRRIETAVAFSALDPPPSAGAPNGGSSGASPAAAKAASASAGKTAAWIALAFAGGLAAGELHGRSAPAPAPTPPAPSTSPPAIALEAKAPSPEPALASAEPTTKPSAAPVPSASSPSKAASSADPVSDLAAEQTLIDTARAALSRGRGGDALRAADEHAKRFPRGRLSQERELLGIQALLLSGRRSDAEARGERFKAAFPRSLYASAIDELLGNAPARKDAGP